MEFVESEFAELDGLPDDAGREEDTGVRTLLTFRLGSQVFAVDVTFVREIVDLRDITPFPSAPAGVLGMIDVRGEAISIIDLAAHLRFPEPSGEECRIIVFSFPEAEGSISLGVTAEQVLRVSEAALAGIVAMPPTTTSWRKDDVEGLVPTEDGKAIVLDIMRILRSGGAVSGAFDFD